MAWKPYGTIEERTCSLCKKVLANPRARVTHEIWHGISDSYKREKEAKSLSQPGVPKLESQERKEPSIMPPEICPTCETNKHRAELAKEAQSKVEAELREARASHDRERADFDSRLKAAQEAQSQLPTLRELIAHCQSGDCKAHADEWDEIKLQVVQEAYKSIPREVIEAKAQELGLAPKEIRIKV